MVEKRCYLAGSMTGYTRDEYSGWREEVLKRITSINKNWKCFNPAAHFSFEDADHTDKQAMDIDLYHLRESDVVIVNFAHHKSLGTMAELGIAYDRGIPVVGYNEHDEDIHPWQKIIATKICSSMDDMIDYVVNEFLED